MVSYLTGERNRVFIMSFFQTLTKFYTPLSLFLICTMYTQHLCVHLRERETEKVIASTQVTSQF